MLQTCEPFPSSEDASLQQCGSISFSLPVRLSLDENFHAKVGLIALDRTQLDGQNEVVVVSSPHQSPRCGV